MSALTLSTRTCVKIALPVLNGRHQVPGPFTCLFMSPELFFCFNEGWWPPQRNSCSNHSGSKWTRNQPSHPPNTLQQTFRGLGADSKSVPGPVVGYLPSPGSQWTGRRAFTRSGESLMVRTVVRLTFTLGGPLIINCDQSTSLSYQTMVTGGYPSVVGYLPSPGSQWTGRRAFTRSGESLMVRMVVRLTFHFGRAPNN